MRTPEEAAQWAEAQLSFSPKGRCLQFSRTAYLVAALWSDASTAWANCDLKHPGDRNPPRGVPVWWTGGSKGFGHVAISLGKGLVRTTDYPRAEVIGTALIDTLTLGWNLRFEGWSEDINERQVWFGIGGDDMYEQPDRARDAAMAITIERLDKFLFQVLKSDGDIAKVLGRIEAKLAQVGGALPQEDRQRIDALVGELKLLGRDRP